MQSKDDLESFYKTEDPWGYKSNGDDIKRKDIIISSLDFICGFNGLCLKNALDIGCGIGKYLKILQAGGFKTDGIDSSETAVEMTKKILNNNSKILCVNMFEFEIPKNNYDLVISINTIHHGTKQQVQNLINLIHKVLVENGKIFITVPNLGNTKKWNTFKDHEKLAEGTFTPLIGPEKGLPHSFYTKKQTQKLFSKFRDLQL